jgi:hypothetical protein
LVLSARGNGPRRERWDRHKAGKKPYVRHKADEFITLLGSTVVACPLASFDDLVGQGRPLALLHFRNGITYFGYFGYSS